MVRWVEGENRREKGGHQLPVARRPQLPGCVTGNKGWVSVVREKGRGKNEEKGREKKKERKKRGE